MGAASDARKEEEQRQTRITLASSRVRNDFAHTFSNQYYDDIAKNYKAFYEKDLNKQYEDARQQMQGALMSSGLFNSWARVKKEGEATRAKIRGDQEITQRGIAAQNQRKQDVEYAQNNVLGQLTSTADASAAYANAANAIRTNNVPVVTPMLGQVITDLGAGLATQADLERNNQNRYTLFGRMPWWSNRGGGNYTRNVGGT